MFSINKTANIYDDHIGLEFYFNKEFKMDMFNTIENKVSPSRAERARHQDQNENSESKRVQLKKAVTDEQIREKIAARFKDAKVDISKKARNHPGKDTSKMLDSTRTGDIANNDPMSEITQDKLRSLLEGGGFHFNEKERAALEEILYRS